MGFLTNPAAETAPQSGFLFEAFSADGGYPDVSFDLPVGGTGYLVAQLEVDDPIPGVYTSSGTVNCGVAYVAFDRVPTSIACTDDPVPCNEVSYEAEGARGGGCVDGGTTLENEGSWNLTLTFVSSDVAPDLTTWSYLCHGEFRATVTGMAFNDLVSGGRLDAGLGVATVFFPF